MSPKLVSIVVIGVLICCALLYSMSDLKTVQMNVQCCLIQEVMLYEFESDHNITEATENIFCMKDEGTVDHSTVTRRFKKFCLGCMNFDNQVISGWLKTMDSEVVLQDIEANPASNTWRVL